MPLAPCAGSQGVDPGSVGDLQTPQLLPERTLASGVTGRVSSPRISREMVWEDRKGWKRLLQAQRAGLAAPRDGRGPAIRSGAQDWAQGQAMTGGYSDCGAWFPLSG